MSHERAQILERLLERYRLGWMIKSYAPPEDALRALLEKLEQVRIAYNSRFGTAVSFSPESLDLEAEQHPQKVAAFLQALGTTQSPAMLVMVWRILEGASISKVWMEYEESRRFNLSVTLARFEDGSGSPDPYDSTDINDAALLRHFGIASLDGAPVFDGFFPLRLR